MLHTIHANSLSGPAASVESPQTRMLDQSKTTRLQLMLAGSASLVLEGFDDRLADRGASAVVGGERGYRRRRLTHDSAILPTNATLQMLRAVKTEIPPESATPTYTGTHSLVSACEYRKILRLGHTRPCVRMVYLMHRSSGLHDGP